MDVRMPDGVLVKNVPDDYSQADLLKRYQSATNITPQLTRAAMGGLPFGEYAPEILKGITSGVHSVAQAGAHAVDKVLPGGAPGLVSGVESWGKNRDDAFSKLFGQAPAGGGLAEGFGEALAPAGVLSKLGPALTAAGRIGQSAGMGGVTSALAPVPETGNYWSDKLKQIGTGAVVGGATGGALEGVSRMLAPKVNPQVQQLMDAGVTPTPGGIMGGAWKATEDKLTSVPLLGDAIKSGQRRSINDFNRAIYQKTLDPVGESAAKLPVGNDGIKAVGDSLSNAYEKALAKSVPSVVDPAYQQATNNLAGMVPSNSRQDFIDAIKRNVDDKITPAGTLTPSAAKQADSELGQLASTYKSSAVASERILGQALAQAQSNLRQMFARYNPQTAPEIRAVDAGWANLVQMENAGAMLGAKEGIFTPSQFLNAVKKSDNSVRDRAFARGTVRNQDFAQAADAVLPNKYPDSGSIGRLLATGAATSGAGGAIMAMPQLAGFGAAALPYTPMGQKLIAGLLTKRPELLKKAGAGLSQASPLLAAPLAGLLGP